MEAKRELSLDELDHVVGGEGIPRMIMVGEIRQSDIDFHFFADGKCPSCHKPFSHDTTCEGCGVYWIEA